MTPATTRPNTQERPMKEAPLKYGHELYLMAFVHNGITAYLCAHTEAELVEMAKLMQVKDPNIALFRKVVVSKP
jgi:hypothetical protein